MAEAREVGEGNETNTIDTHGAALMAAFLAFGSSGVAFAQDEPAVWAGDVTEDEKCADLVVEYEESVVEGNAENMGGVAEEIEYCLAQVVEGQE